MLHTSGFPPRAARPRRAWGDPRGPPASGSPTGGSTGSPARSYEYHPTSAHWVLAEIIDRVTGERLPRRARAPHHRPARAAGRVLGLARDQQDGIAELVAVGEQATPDELQAAFGIRELPVTEVTVEALIGFNDPAKRGRSACPAAAA